MALPSVGLRFVLPLAALAGLAGLTAGCASPAALGHAVEITSATLSSANLDTGSSGEALRDGDYVHALALADHALKSWPESPWATYDRAAAMHRLGLLDAAVAAYRTAQERFGTSDSWGAAIAIYGRARAYDDAGRCLEATAAYEEYATLVHRTDPDGARMARAYALACGARPQADKGARDSGESPVATNMVSDILGHDYSGAVALAESTSPGAWIDYNRAVALAGLGRTDEAVTSFTSAERRFEDANDVHGQAIALYGRARALDQAGRCTAATASYEAYATFARGSNPEDADRALRIANLCAAR